MSEQIDVYFLSYLISYRRASLQTWKETSPASGRSQAKYSEIASFGSDGDAEVSALSVHPLGTYILPMITLTKTYAVTLILFSIIQELMRYQQV